MPDEARLSTEATSVIVSGDDLLSLVALLDWLDIEHPQECVEGCWCARSRLRRVIAGQSDRGPCTCPHFDIFADDPACPYHGATTRSAQ
jgi:hypothetical protein